MRKMSDKLMVSSIVKCTVVDSGQNIEREKKISTRITEHQEIFKAKNQLGNGNWVQIKYRGIVQCLKNFKKMQKDLD